MGEGRGWVSVFESTVNGRKVSLHPYLTIFRDFLTVAACVRSVIIAWGLSAVAKIKYQPGNQICKLVTVLSASSL